VDLTSLDQSCLDMRQLLSVRRPKTTSMPYMIGCKTTIRRRFSHKLMLLAQRIVVVVIVLLAQRIVVVVFLAQRIVVVGFLAQRIVVIVVVVLLILSSLVIDAVNLVFIDHVLAARIVQGLRVDHLQVVAHHQQLIVNNTVVMNMPTIAMTMM
jgi:hypothetical protein